MHPTTHRNGPWICLSVSLPLQDLVCPGPPHSLSQSRLVDKTSSSSGLCRFQRNDSSRRAADLVRLRPAEALELLRIILLSSTFALFDSCLDWLLPFLLQDTYRRKLHLYLLLRSAPRCRIDSSPYHGVPCDGRGGGRSQAAASPRGHLGHLWQHQHGSLDLCHCAYCNLDVCDQRALSNRHHRNSCHRWSSTTAQRAPMGSAYPFSSSG